jgi:hypothetical protein
MTTQVAHGAWRQESSLNNIDWTSGAEWLRIAVLLIAGMAATALHSKLPAPLKLPGHHGLEWMAILLFARCASPYRWAAIIVAIGAASASAVPIWGFKEPGYSYALVYLVQGVALDALYMAGMRVRHWVLALALFGAAAYATKPFVHWLLLQSVGGRYGSVSRGLWYPVASHLMFGFTGAFTGALLWKAAQRYRHSDSRSD